MAIRLNDDSRRRALRVTFVLELFVLVVFITVLAMRASAREQPPLHKAAVMGEVSDLERLINRGADVDAKDYQGLTPLHAVAGVGRSDVAEILIGHGADVSARTGNSMTPLEFAANADHTAVAEILLKHGADPNAENPLYSAAARGNAALVELLIEWGADVNAVSMSATPLWIAAFHGRKDVAEILLDHGADVNVRDNSGRTPLFEAIRWGHANTVRLLLRRGAEVNVISEEYGYGGSPLHESVESAWSPDPKSFVEIVKLLIDAGADVDAKYRQGRTALQLATVNAKNRESRARHPQTALPSVVPSALQLSVDAEIVQLLEQRGAEQP